MQKLSEHVLNRFNYLGLSGEKVKIVRVKSTYSNIVYRVQTKNKSLILKIITDSFIDEKKIAEKEVELLKTFGEISPRPILSDTYNGHPAIFMESISGTTLSKARISIRDVSNSARLLAQIHSTKISPKVNKLLDTKYLKVPEENLNGSLQWLKKLGKDPITTRTAKIYHKFHKFYRKNIPKKKKVLCHGEFSLGNIIKDGVNLRVFDWETALMGDPAYDIAWLLVTSEYKKLLLRAQAKLFVEKYLALRLDLGLQDRIMAYSKLCNLQALFWEIREYYLSNRLSKELNELPDKSHVYNKIMENLDVLEDIDLNNEERMLFVK